MSQRVLIGIFDSEDAILQVTHSARRRGLKIVDVFAPYAVHGLDKAMGLERSKLPWVLFAGISTVLAFLGMNRLWPGRRTTLLDPRVTSDRFALVLEEDNAAFDVDEIGQFLREHQAIRVEEREQEIAV